MIKWSEILRILNFFIQGKVSRVEGITTQPEVYL